MRRLLIASAVVCCLTACTDGKEREPSDAAKSTAVVTTEDDVPKVPLKTACLSLFIPEGPVPAFQKVWLEDVAQSLTRDTKSAAGDALEETTDLLPALPPELAAQLETMASETERVLFPTDTEPVASTTFIEATEELLRLCDAYI